MRSSPILITATQWERLLANGPQIAPGQEIFVWPVVRLFQPDAADSWLLTHFDPADPSCDRIYALHRRGGDQAELGFISLAALGALGRADPLLRVERDCRFRADRSLAAYATEAQPKDQAGSNRLHRSAPSSPFVDPDPLLVFWLAPRPVRGGGAGHLLLFLPDFIMLTHTPDLYQSITDRILATMQAGTDPWQLPWRTPAGLHRPSNIASGQAYRGINILALWAEAQLRGYSSPVWGTYRQWLAQGAQVRKGERSATIVFYKAFSGNYEQDALTDEPSSRTRLIARASAVFNAAQVDGYEPPASPTRPAAATIPQLEQFISSTGARIRYAGLHAAYRPSTDEIRLPPRDAFVGSTTSTATESYGSTILHELVHWTAPKHRLDRDLTGRFGSAAYAMEELVAELGAAFLCADLGLTNEPRADHAAYLASWLQVLQVDRRAIFTAASKAAKAAEFLHAFRTAEPASTSRHRKVPADMSVTGSSNSQAA